MSQDLHNQLVAKDGGYSHLRYCKTCGVLSIAERSQLNSSLYLGSVVKNHRINSELRYQLVGEHYLDIRRISIKDLLKKKYPFRYLYNKAFLEQI